MTRTSKHRGAARFAVAVLGVGLAGTAIAATQGTAAEPIQCEIHVAEHGGTVDLEAMVRVTATTDGTYEFTISGGGADGNSDIAQSGEFSVAAGNESAVGSVTLTSTGGTYVAKLLVTAAGRTSHCTKRIVGSL
jgi:hypothetical protein